MTARIAAGLLVAAALAAPAAAGAATWSAPVTADVAKGPARVTDPVVVPGSNGTNVTAWVRRNPGGSGLMARFGNPGGAQQLLVHSSANRIAAPTLLTQPGEAIFGWRWDDGSVFRVRARAVRTASMRLTALQTLTGGGSTASAPAFVAGPGGARLAWLRGSSTPDLELASPGANGRFAGTVRYLIPGLLQADASVTRTGGNVVAYTKRISGVAFPRLTVATQGTGGLRDVAQFEGDGPASDPAVGVEPDGTIVVAWVETIQRITQRVLVATRAPGAAEFTAPRVLDDGVSADDVAVLPKSDGDTLVSWLQSASAATLDDAGSRLMVATPAGIARRISDVDDTPLAYGAAADGRGSAHFVYRDISTSPRGGPLVEVTVDGAEHTGVRKRVTAKGELAATFSVGASAGGAVAVAWSTADGRRIRLRERR